MKNKSYRILQIIVVFILIFTTELIFAQKQKAYYLYSPDHTVKVMITTGKELQYTVEVDGKEILNPSSISMTIKDHKVLGKDARVSGTHKRAVNKEIFPVVQEKFKVIKDNYNELSISFKGGYSVIFRAYNNGLAYRFITGFKGEIKVVSEESKFVFSGNNYVYYPEEKSFMSHNERLYLHKKLDTMKVGRLASLPVLVETIGPKVLITESALRDYPGMWLLSGKNNSLDATFSKYALEDKLEPQSDRNVRITKTANYIAKTKGKRSFPWRILAIAKKDADLITNELVYQLADKLEIKDPSWIKPGKVAWDWWNFNNIYKVDFKAGINTKTYKYYIDFASRFGIQYIILDEGWYKLGNLMEVVPEINMEELLAYGKQKNVRIILWVVWKTLDDQMKIALDQFKKWGVAGIKVDFMQRDDQKIVNYYWKIAEEAAKRNMLVDFHGAYKPAGLRRTYPNVISREGVKGLENSKWSKDITPSHNLTLPFTRMVAGPMDYTPGSMLNAQPKMFSIVWRRPMSMGTRMHQIAMYVIYESPLQMLADSPSNYLSELESTEFISKIPTVWDDTKVLEAKVGKYLIIARKNGDKWYIGAMTNEQSRTFNINLSFLGAGAYTAEIMKDGLNADRYAGDYSKETRTVIKSDSLKINLAPGGGWSAILIPE